MDTLIISGVKIDIEYLKNYCKEHHRTKYYCR